MIGLSAIVQPWPQASTALRYLEILPKHWQCDWPLSNSGRSYGQTQAVHYDICLYYQSTGNGLTPMPLDLSTALSLTCSEASVNEHGFDGVDFWEIMQCMTALPCLSACAPWVIDQAESGQVNLFKDPAGDVLAMPVS